MEVSSPPKRLHKHALPIVMLAVGLLALPALAFSTYNDSSLHSESALARGLVTQVLHVKPTPNGLARVTLDSSSTVKTKSYAGSELRGGLGGAGSTAELSLDLQTPGQ